MNNSPQIGMEKGFFIFLPLKRNLESVQNNNGKREKSKLEVRFKELFSLPVKLIQTGHFAQIHSFSAFFFEKS